MSMNITMQDQQAIQDVMQATANGWNHNDARAYMAPFTDDTEYRTWFGAKVAGREAIIPGLQALFDGPYQQSHMEIQIDSIRLFSPTIAHVEVWHDVQHAHLPFERALASVVMVKSEDQWQIASFNNAGIWPPPPGMAPQPD